METESHTVLEEPGKLALKGFIAELEARGKLAKPVALGGSRNSNPGREYNIKALK